MDPVRVLTELSQLVVGRLVDDDKDRARADDPFGRALVRLVQEGEPATEVDDVALGDEVRVYRETVGLGRIAAQTAKQVLYQKVREAERDNIYNEYFPKIGELMSGTVKRFERGDMIVALGETEAILPKREESRAEHYNVGDRIRAIIVDVDRSGKGPQAARNLPSPAPAKSFRPASWMGPRPAGSPAPARGRPWPTG